MKFLYKILVLNAIVLLTSHCNQKSDDSNENLILGLVAGRQLGIQQASTFQGNLKFNAIFDGRPIACGEQIYTMPGGQEVHIRDFRFFIQDIQFVRPSGKKVRFQMNSVDNWQITDSSGDQLALIDFTTVGKGRCVGTSDTPETRTIISGRIPNERFESVEITIGVPNRWNHIDPTQQPATSPLKSATGLTWNWLAGYKFIRLELEGTAAIAANRRLLLHLGSTNCNGDINIPFGQPGSVSCKNPYRPTLVLKPEGGFNPAVDTILIDVDEFFRGNGGVPLTSYDPNAATPVPLSCMPIGNGAGLNGNPTTCGPILRNLGLKPGTQAGFNNILVNEENVGTINLETQQPILRKL